jgi:hypothetical protein
MKRRFNTAGPCRPEYHYMIPASGRTPEALELVEQMGYFVVHAPRQTGKTTAIRAIAEELTASGRYSTLAFGCEIGKAVGDDYGAAQRAILQQIRRRAKLALPPELRPPPWPEAPDEDMLGAALTAWALACPRPLVLFFDDIDALAGRSLISVLSQLRAGFNERPYAFPASVVLCGLRDVRHYHSREADSRFRGSEAAASGGDSSRFGSPNPFNIKIESLRLGDFTADEVAELYGQHTAETGQEFTPEAVERVVKLTAGQPWLVNALAREIVEKLEIPVSEPITLAHVEQANERLLPARATHFDSLVARLAEPRLRRVLERVLAGNVPDLDPYNDDLSYAYDLGLIAPTRPVCVANPIYEIIYRWIFNSKIDPETLGALIAKWSEQEGGPTVEHFTRAARTLGLL